VNDLERWVVLINSLMAFVAMLVNAGTAHATPEPWRSVRIPIAVLAAIYCVAYLWLFFAEDVGPWSSIMRGVSILSWPIVWIRPAIVNRRIVDAMRHAVKTASAVADRTIGDQK
jgi:hypothetical protein